MANKQKKNPLRIYFEGKTDAPLTRSNKHIIALAGKAGLSVETVYRATLGDRLPGLTAARQISNATKPSAKAAPAVQVTDILRF